MNHHSPSRIRPLAVLMASSSFATLFAAYAQAQTAPAAPAAGGDVVDLERVVVTGTPSGGSKMKQSVSVSTLEQEQIAKQAPASAAEILRSVPGVRSESSGGEGNANLTVRGLPISAGGARYVQFQEDGLPVLLFGDIAFGTSDQFVRADYTLDHLEVVRGGSASTLATNSPGGIANFISKDGSDPGGAIGLTLGVDGGRQTRVDFTYGGKLGEKTRFQIGGFNRNGEGDRPTGFTAASGGQVKGSLTQDFDSGFVRLNFKVLDDKTPSFMPVPTYVEGGRIKQIPGVDPRTAWFIGPDLTRDPVVDSSGQPVVTRPQDGLHVRSTAIGLESEFTLGDNWKLVERFRRASNSGRFIALFPANNGDGTTPLTSNTFTATLFNTSIDDLGNTSNDLKVSKTFGEGDAPRTTVTAGLFNSVQDVAMTWFWNQYQIDMTNKGGSATLVSSGWDTWGGCCARTFNVQYTTTAPYAAVNWSSGPLTLDGSVRRDVQRARGEALQDDPAAQTWDPSTRQEVNYKVSHTSYSLGGNFQFNRDTAAFARVSNGVAFSADRLLYGNPLDGSVPVAVNEVDQIEAGLKWRHQGISLFATLFNAKTAESNYEATTQQFTSNRYRATGLELELGYRSGDVRVLSGLTLTRARITAASDASVVGNKPRRQADYTFQISPSYTLGAFEIGASLIGTGKSYGDDANTITMPGFTVVNGFASWHVNESTDVMLSVNNLTNAIGYTEVEGDGHAARSINGRTAKIALRHNF